MGNNTHPVNDGLGAPGGERAFDGDPIGVTGAQKLSFVVLKARLKSTLERTRDIDFGMLATITNNLSSISQPGLSRRLILVKMFLR